MKRIYALLACASAILPATSWAQTQPGTPPGPPPGPEKAMTPSNGPSTLETGTTITNGGLPQVWAIPAKSRYFCPSDKRYGKGRRGAYMSEADARNAGDRPAHGKTCS